MTPIQVRHRTLYRYAQPVRFDEHRVLCRPRDSHDLRLLETGLSIFPPAGLSWLHDVFGNSVLIASFEEPGDHLLIESTFRAEHYPATPDLALIERYARSLPFSYDAAEMPDLARSVERHYADPGHRLDAWVRELRAETGSNDTMEVLIAITEAVKKRFVYEARESEGVQPPALTLQRGRGCCRDFALLMMEAVRSQGLAARFVSGYLYDESLIGAGDAAGQVLGGGSTHAWLQVYLPGAGWLPFDPTNAIVGEHQLIRVAVARDPAQVTPVSGSFWGRPGDFLGMSVEVSVTASA